MLKHSGLDFNVYELLPSLSKITKNSQSLLVYYRQTKCKVRYGKKSKTISKERTYNLMAKIWRFENLLMSQSSSASSNSQGSEKKHFDFQTKGIMFFKIFKLSHIRHQSEISDKIRRGLRPFHS